MLRGVGHVVFSAGVFSGGSSGGGAKRTSRALAFTTAGVLGISGATVAVLAGQQAASAGSAESAASAGITWGSCTDQTLATVGATCGFVTVPLDWSKPAGTKIKIRVSKVAAKGRTNQGVMLVNPGGPGGSGLVWPAILQDAVPHKVGQQYDWIGWDPRGVGESRPALSCNPDYFANPRPAYKPASAAKITGTEYQWIKRTKAYVAACEKNGALLAHVKSIDTVRDMDAIRKALGKSQINYYGYSYGTFLGQAYATQYPTKIRRIVLDGNVSPNYPGYGDGGLRQMVGFEGVITEFFAWVAKYDRIYKLGSTGAEVRAAYEGELAKLTKEPRFGIGPAELTDVFLLAGYAESRWTQVAAAFADFREGDSTGVQILYQAAGEPGNDNSYAAFNSTLCTDGPFPKSYARVRKDAYRIAKTAPFLVWGSYWYSQPCTYWTTPAGAPLKIDGSKIKNMLLINAEKDGATPLQGALDVRQEFPRSVLVKEVGATTHGGSLRGNRCLDDTVAAYLADGTLPERLSGDRADKNCARGAWPAPSPLDRSLPKSTGGLLDQTSLVGALLDNLRMGSRN